MAADIKPLERFFAVSMTSVYRVSLENGKPIVEKIAMRRGDKVVTLANTKSDAAEVVVVTKVALFMCTKGENGSAILYTSSFLVGLFFEEDDAMQCAKLQDLVPLDLRCKEATERVVSAIGLHHPYFLLRKPPGIFCLEENGEAFAS